MVDRSFGFETAVQECTRAINSALVEAMSCEYGVGIVKLMGREAGYIAAYATLASHDVDLCLIPEVDIDLSDDGDYIPDPLNILGMMLGRFM